MTGYIILIAFAVFVFSVFGAFLFGYTKGRAKEQAEQKEEALRKAESDRAFEAEKENIRQEVYNHAENEKAKLSGGSGRSRFDAINNSLRDNKN
jgi:flagellar biosynthesis/type III secretory pathway M-ring protein FliF/YscJ